MTAKLTYKQRAFIIEYLKDFNASQAAIRAGYSRKSAYTIGNENIKKPAIKAEIEKHLDARSMQPVEVIDRLTDHARGSVGDFIDVNEEGFQFNLSKAERLGLLHLIKRIKDKVVVTFVDDERTETHYIELELYDAQNALIQLARIRGLYVERYEIAWQREVVELLTAGAITPADVLEELGADLATELFISAGISPSAIGETEGDSTSSQ